MLIYPFQAESISYAVCQYYGIQTGENSFGYIAGWSQGKELKELRASLETINKTSCELISDIDRHYKEICKERGIDLRQKEEVAAETEPPKEAGPFRYYITNEAAELGVYPFQEGSQVHFLPTLESYEDGKIRAFGYVEYPEKLSPEEIREYALVPAADTLGKSEMENTEPGIEQQEALLALDDSVYLHIQPCDTGWDYTLYDAVSMKELDGGQLDDPGLPRSKAVLQICEDHNLGGKSMKYAPLSMVDTLQEAAYQQMQEQAGQQAEENALGLSQLPDAMEQSLDEYPMPDSQLSAADMREYGYLYDGMLPVTRERALELDAAGLTVYVLHEDNTESMVLDADEIMEHGGLFGVDHEEWEHSPQFHEKVLERQEHQQEREQAFLDHKGDCFAIYQVCRDDPQNVRFMNLDWLQSHDISVDRSNYDLIYTAPLDGSVSADAQLEKIYEQFNLEKPVDFHSPSLSVSDIVAVKRDGMVSCHYCDSVGFAEIPGFLPDNPLKNAEMSMEDDYGMIDGIINNGTKEPTVAQLEQQARSGQPISLMDLAAAAHREEQDKRKSVVEQLHQQPKQENKKTAPKKSAEREI